MISPTRLFIISLAVMLSSCKNEVKETEPADTLFSLVPSKQSNLNFINKVVQTRKNNHMINTEFISGGGVALGDVNNDGLLDIFFTGNQVSDRLFLNKGHLKFEDITEKSGIPADNSWSSGVTFVDIDNDGDLDIYVCKNIYLENEKSANKLYINNGDLTFTEQAEKFGLADKGFSLQANFFDFNNDGLVDMYLVNQPPSIPNIGNKLRLSQFSDPKFSDKLYKNMGNGKFVDYTIEANVRNFSFGLSASVGDLNNDGWQDIYVTNDFDVADHLYINQQDGTFKDEVFTGMKHISNFSMGSDMADYDNDGNLDIMIVDMVAEDHKRIKTNMGGMNPEKFWNIVSKGGHYQYMFNTLQRNNGNGTFSELAQLAGVSNTDWSWSPLMADFDNDGYKDLFVTNGILSNNRYSDLNILYEKKLDSIRKVARKRGVDPRKMIDMMDFVNMAPTDKLSNYIYKNNGDLTYTNKVKDWGMETPTLSNGAAYGDLDNDGDLELVINNINENAFLYKNNTMEREKGNYIRFKIDPIDNQNIYGTKVTLFRNGKLWQTNYVSSAMGYKSKSEDLLHFGTGKLENIERVVIQWPNGAKKTLHNVKVNQLYKINPSDQDKESRTEIVSGKNQLFKEITTLLKLDKARHIENEYDDFKQEILLPHKMSQFGPYIAVGDVNGDHLEDFFMGGAAGFPGALYIQNKNRTFKKIPNGAWTQDSMCEDMGVALIDVDGDKDLDLFIVSGGNEFNEGDKKLQDRLYINNGTGKFTKQKDRLPEYLISGSCVVPNDFDQDGDIDLFIGGRLTPHKYPLPTNSYLLENRGGYFVNVTNEKAPDFVNLGMVTSASWFDYNKDGRDDLVVVGEWMPVTIFTQSPDGKFKKEILSGLENSEGWYFSVQTADMDEDGDQDIIVGNLGLNYKYKASIDEPFEVYSYDFDNNGSLDIVLSYYEHGELFPVRGKSCSTQQIPSLKEKFPTYEQFGNSDLKGIYGSSIENAYNLKAKTFASAYIENKGNGSFLVKPLPSLAQVSSINSILTKDFDLDGIKDLVIIGNLYPAEIETPRNDAGTGLFLKGNGKGNFTPLSIMESGFYAPGDAKNMKLINVKDQEIILVGNNDDFLQAIEHISPE